MKIVENIDRHIGKYAGISTTTLHHILDVHNQTEDTPFDIVAGMKIATRLIATKHPKAHMIVMSEQELELAKADPELNRELLGEEIASST